MNSFANQIKNAFIVKKTFWIGFGAGMLGIFLSQGGITLPSNINPFMLHKTPSKESLKEHRVKADKKKSAAYNVASRYK